jgi:geranylgeranyl pyrophosphate synthase
MKHARDAREQLQTLKRDEATDALASLTDYVVTRKL